MNPAKPMVKTEDDMAREHLGGVKGSPDLPPGPHRFLNKRKTRRNLLIPATRLNQIVQGRLWAGSEF